MYWKYSDNEDFIVIHSLIKMDKNKSVVLYLAVKMQVQGVA